MKSNWIYVLLLLLLTNTLLAEPKNEQFTSPLMIKNGLLYTGVRIDISQFEVDESELYERTRSLYITGEYRFSKYFSANLGIGRFGRVKTDTEPRAGFERGRLGIKGTYFWSETFFTTLFFNYYTSQPEEPPREDEEPNFFLLEGGVSLGYAVSYFKLSANLYFQSESNARFKEKYGQQFRRFSQIEVGISKRVSERFELHLETAYREPYNKKIDVDTRFWNLYPGVSYSINNYTLALAFQHPLRGEVLATGAKVSLWWYF